MRHCEHGLPRGICVACLKAGEATSVREMEREQVRARKVIVARLRGLAATIDSRQWPGDAETCRRAADIIEEMDR